ADFGDGRAGGRRLFAGSGRIRHELAGCAPPWASPPRIGEGTGHNRGNPSGSRRERAGEGGDGERRKVFRTAPQRRGSFRAGTMCLDQSPNLVILILNERIQLLGKFCWKS